MSLIDTIYSSFSDPYPYPAMADSLFESAGKDARRLAIDFVGNCISLARRNQKPENRIPLLEWLVHIVQESKDHTVAFFGSSVYGGAGFHSSDVEAIQFVSDSERANSYHVGLVPPDATLLKVFESRFIQPHFQEHDLPYLFAGPALLYPSAPHRFALERMDSARRAFFGADEEDGIMVRVTHSASKVLNNQEFWLFDSAVASSRFIGRSLSRTSMIQHGDFGTKPTIADVHDAYERQLSILPDEDLSALAKAALKRIRVKEEHRERLAEKYVARIKRWR